MGVVVVHLRGGEGVLGGPVVGSGQARLVVTRHHVEGHILDVVACDRADTKHFEGLRYKENHRMQRFYSRTSPAGTPMPQNTSKMLPA